MADHMTAPGSDVRGNVLPSGLRRDPVPSSGCYRVALRNPRGVNMRPIIDADSPEQAIEKGLVLFPDSILGRPLFLHGRGHLCPEPVAWKPIERRKTA